MLARKDSLAFWRLFGSPGARSMDYQLIRPAGHHTLRDIRYIFSPTRTIPFDTWMPCWQIKSIPINSPLKASAFILRISLPYRKYFEISIIIIIIIFNN